MNKGEIAKWVRSNWNKDWGKYKLMFEERYDTVLLRVGEGPSYEKPSKEAYAMVDKWYDNKETFNRDSNFRVWLMFDYILS